jgi:hypothetical protein
MNIGPTELIIIGALCCIPIVLAAVIAVVVVIVKSLTKNKIDNN